MNDALTFRPATAEDAELLAEMERQTIAHPWPLSAVASHLTSPVGEGLLLLCGGRPAGYLLLRVIPPEFEVLRVGVLPSLRRRGLGQALLRRALLDLHDRGCTDGYLEVRVSNAAALALYRRLGWVGCGARPRYYTDPVEDALCMRLRLPPQRQDGD